MPCCGQAQPGFTHAYQLRQVGKPVLEFATKNEAEAAKAAAGNRGVVLRITRKL